MLWGMARHNDNSGLREAIDKADEKVVQMKRKRELFVHALPSPSF